MTVLDKGIRIMNFIIDMIMISIISEIINHILRGKLDPYFLKFLCYIFYYLIFESIFKKTLGKAVTNTKVVGVNNSNPSVFRILIRTILRFNPLDIISFVFGFGTGTHDVYSKTKLIFDESGNLEN